MTINYWQHNNTVIRAPQSTKYSTIKLFDNISKEMDSGNTPTALYIDLSKAFDTFFFDIILQ